GRSCKIPRRSRRTWARLESLASAILKRERRRRSTSRYRRQPVNTVSSCTFSTAKATPARRTFRSASTDLALQRRVRERNAVPHRDFEHDIFFDANHFLKSRKPCPDIHAGLG